EYLIYSGLILMGIFTMLQPDWLVAISAPGKDVEISSYIEQGNILLTQGDFRSAILNYKKALAINPDHQAVIGNLGLAYSQLKEYATAINYYKKLLQMDNIDHGKTYYNLAELYSLQKDHENAINNYINALDFVQDPTNTYQKLGYHYVLIKEFNQAINAFEKALQMSTDINTYYRSTRIDNVPDSLAVPQKKLLIQEIRESCLGEDEHRKYDARSFQEDPHIIRENAKTHNYLGIANFELGNLEDAKHHFEMAVQLWPGFSEAKHNLKKLSENNP
ncbi:MAG: tetratricopeptide repeat protein, partial [Candidatus Cloacimonetes bacterium]|nr:tetratricopeptide repeat protein [Candidatus Cloacimonadota bacterium]